MVTVMVNGVFPTIAKQIDKAIGQVSVKVMIADYKVTTDLQSVVIICEYVLLVEVIRRIHSICASPCDYIDVVIK